MVLRQADIARETGVSAMTICRRLRALDSVGAHLSDQAAISILAAQELEQTGIPGSAAVDMLADFPAQIRWLLASPGRQCWLVFAESERARFTAAASSQTHLSALLSAFPMSRTMPLHEIVGRAKERLEGMKARLATAEAA